MWQRNPEPYRFSRPDPVENEDSAGYADPLGNAVTAFAVVFVVALIAFLTWAHQAGKLPLWG